MWQKGGSGRTNAFKDVKRCRKCNRTVKNVDWDFREGFCFNHWILETQAGRNFKKMCDERKAERKAAVSSPL